MTQQFVQKWMKRNEMISSRAPSTVPTPQSSLKQSFKMEDPPSSKKSARNGKEKINSW